MQLQVLNWLSIVQVNLFLRTQNVIISVYLLCVDGVILIISDHEDKTIWKILVMEN